MNLIKIKKILIQNQRCTVTIQTFTLLKHLPKTNKRTDE